MSTEPENDRPEQAEENAAEEISRQEETAAAPKKRALPPSRIVFLVFVALAGIVIVIELRARWTYTSTVERIDQAWETASEEGKGLYRGDLDKLIGGSPTREYDQKLRLETITWRGIRSHGLEVQYGQGDFVTNYKTLGGD